MRIFELMIILSITFLWANRIWNKSVPTMKKYWIGLSFDSAIIVFHLIFEGARWQMSLAYISSLIFWIVEGMRLYKNVDNLKNKKLKSTILTIMLTIYTLICVAFPIAFPVFKFEKPTGKYAVGTSDYTFTDISRKTSSGENRNINVQIWYPALINESAKKANYISNLDNFSQAFEEKFSVPSFLFNYLNLIDTNTYSDVPVAKESDKFPVVFFSHGNMLGERFTNTFLTTELASHGYIVVAVENPEIAFMSAYYDANPVAFDINIDEIPLTYEDINSSSLPQISQQTKDIEFVLSELTKSDDVQISSNMDFSKIGIIGHSLGGASAVDLLYNNDNFKVAINFDGYLYGENRTTPLEKPLLIMNGTEDNNDEIEIENAKIEKARRDIVLKKNGESINIEGTGHLSYTDLPLYSPFIEFKSTRKVNKQHKEINEIALEFLNRNLNEDTSSN